MSSSDFSTDVGLLPPASSVRAVEGHSPKQDADGKPRRQRHPREEEVSDRTDSNDAPAHQIDRLA